MAYATTIIIEVARLPLLRALLVALGARASARGGGATSCSRRVVLRRRATSSASAEFTTLPARLRGRGRRPLAHRPARPRASGATGSRGDTLGAVVLAVGALFLFNRVVLQHIQQWQVTIAVLQEPDGRPRPRGRRSRSRSGSASCRSIGGLVSLRLPERRGDRDLPRLRRLDRRRDRHALDLHRRQGRLPLDELRHALGGARPDLPLAAPAPRHGDGASRRAGSTGGSSAPPPRSSSSWSPSRRSSSAGPYFEAPGSAIRGGARVLRALDARTTSGSLLLGMLVLSLGLLALRRRRFAAPLAGGAARARLDARRRDHDDRRASTRSRTTSSTTCPAQLDWVDAHVHGQPVTYLGQAVIDPNGENLTEFWNRSIKHVDEPRRHRARARAHLDAAPLRPDRPPRREPPATPTSSPTSASSSTAHIVAKEGDMTLYRRRARGICSTPSSRSTPTAGAPTGAASPTSSRTRAGS